MNKKPKKLTPLGAVIDKAMKRKKLSTVEAAAAAGLSHSALYRIMDGSRGPSAATLRKIAGALDLDAGKLAAKTVES